MAGNSKKTEGEVSVEEKFQIWKDSFLEGLAHSSPSQATQGLFAKTFATIEQIITRANKLDFWLKVYIIVDIILRLALYSKATQ